MTIDFYDGSTVDGLFNILGRVFAAQNAINTARGTTLPTAVTNVLDQFQLLSPDTERSALAANIPAGLVGYQASGSGLMSILQSFASQFLIDFVHRDTPLTSKTLYPALVELIRQMDANSQTVDRSTVTITPTAGVSNTGNGKIICSPTNRFGDMAEQTIPEIITAKVVTAGENGIFQFTSGIKANDRLGYDWPLDSQLSARVGSISADTQSLLTNGTFDDFTSNIPDGWIPYIATAGTTVYGTTVEVQTVAISGTPTGGFYLLHFTDQWSNVYSTAELDYNASAASVQSALREIPGLESVTVAATGTTPNFTHSITFTGCGGNQSQLTSTSKLTGGTPSITHGTTTGGTAYVHRGSRALVLDSDGSEQTALYQKISGLRASTAYCASLWACVDVVPAAGTLLVEFVDGIAGTVIDSATFNAASMTTSFKHISQVTAAADDCILRTPAALPEAIYLRVRIGTAVSSGTSVFLDECSLQQCTELYAGGPLVAVVTGSRDWVLNDEFSIAATNDRAGLLQEWFERNFAMSELGLLLPSNGSGSETIPDSVVA